MLGTRFPLAHTEILRELSRIQDEVNRVFEGLAFDIEYPPLNIWNNAEKVLVDVELPGYTADQIEVTVSGETLTVAGERKENAPQDAEWHRRERFSGRFSKTIRLPYPVEASRVEARLENGILKLELPRSEADKPRKITVKG
ncbi:MAG: Hsp20/alpha crystallin family protein [Leptospiraceae bacterium]|nr:Hsp20/alpha crystallin family protein [Leptospiraceae bacterium]MDW8307583.1 Hsp20/alpha crystallin family protein [Leptospiraceae bacterium]